MKTENLSADHADHLTRAAELLTAGKLVAVPTETVYGLAADASNSAAVARIFTAKGRPPNHPLIVHIASPDEMCNWAEQIPAAAYTLAEQFWPGPLTLLLKKAAKVDAIVTGGQPNIALRTPAHPVIQTSRHPDIQTLLRMTKLGLAAPSANPYQQVSPTQAKHVAAGLDGKIDAILDGGSCALGMESTILDLTQHEPQILRNGPITAEAIALCLGCDVAQPQQHDVAISGNKRQHYQPKKPLYLFNTDQLHDILAITPPRIALVAYSESLKTRASTHRHLICLAASPEKTRYAQALYSTLHELDSMDIDAIWIERPPQTPEWNDVNDRLKRAASR